MRSFAQVAVALAAVMLSALPAQARFGKAGSSSSKASGSTASTSSVHAAAPPSSGPARGSVVPSGGRATPWRPSYGWGFYVPPYGYGYGYGYASLAPPALVVEPVAAEVSNLRVTAGLEAMTYVNGERGVTLGLQAQLEGERWGFLLGGQNIAVRSLDGAGFDLIQQAQARVTYAFLRGEYGRLRAELGADAVFAPSITLVGPSVGLSGVLWIAGPVALESNVLITPFPFWQLDYRAGVVVGIGQVGLRAGWRTQVLDDRGVVDGVVHRDVYMGPYVGASIAF